MIICKDRAILLFLLLIIHLDEAGANKKRTTRKKRLCKQAGKILDNGSFTSLNEKKRKYVCRSNFVSNIPDLEKLTFKCKFERKSDSYEWEAKLTRVDTLYLRNVTCERANRKRTGRKAKCAKPKEVQNAVLRDKYANKAKFKEGDKVEYDCELGYTIEGITRERWCRNTKWTEVRFTCNRMNTNGDISIDEKLAGNNGYKEYIGDREFTVIQLDMIIDKSERRPSRPESYRAIFDKDETKRWKITVPFEIDDGIGDLQELSIRRALPIWEQYSCLNFYENKQVYNRLVFKIPEDNWCGSEVGMKQGPQIIYLGKSCFEPEIIVHEIGHALGFYHEHNRWDRDNYIKIHYGNIEPGYNKSFIKEKPKYADFDHDYDYLSIMHYGQYFFSKNASAKLITIEPTNPNFQSRIGNVKFPSFQDYKTLNAMYKCEDVCAKVKCPEGGFLGKHCQCYCKGNADDTPVKLCFQKEECPQPFVNTYLFDVMNKDNTSLINMNRTSFPDKTILNLISTNWNCSFASQLRCEGGKWSKTDAECPVALDIEMIDETEGVVEVILNGVYRGYICDDDWDDNDATVACKMLGYTNGLAYFQKPQEVNESLPFLLDNVQCSGKEQSLADCKHNAWGNHDCEYSEVVSIRCFDGSFTNHIDKMHCGKITLNDSKRKKRQLNVFGGFETIMGMHPWQVEIQRRKKRVWIHWCGGTIINNAWILSAAHCFDDLKRKYDGFNAKLDSKDVRVIVGDHDLTKQDEYEEMFHVEYIVKHWNYSVFERKYSNNDIALLKIKSTSGISFNNFVQPACLPEEFMLLSPETKCEVSGWGKDRERGTISDILKAAEVTIIKEHVCHRLYKTYPINFRKVICAGGSADTCQGDSGGPLICEINGQSTVIGITSWGKGCGQENHPGVYTKVSEYIRWINNQVSNHRLEEAISCPTLSQLQHGRLHQSKKDALANKYGSIVTYICHPDYILNGNAQIQIVQRTCQSDGKWSGHEPTCEAMVCPPLSRIQNARLLQDTSTGFANNYENENEYTCDKGMCVKQVKREIVRLEKSKSRPAIELHRYACNHGNYVVRVRIKEVTYNDKTQMTAIGIVMASLIQGIEVLQKGDEMFFHSNISCRSQELEQGKTYIITGYDGNKFRDDEGHVRFVYPIMGTTLVMEYISPQQYRVDRRNYNILYKVQSNFERIMLTYGCQHK